MRPGFLQFLESKQTNKRYAADLVRYLDKYVSEIPITEPGDVIRIFAGMKAGQRQVWRALRNLFNYAEITGGDPDFLNSLRKALPKISCGIDVRVPSEEAIVESLRKAECLPLKYKATYSLLVDSGLRLIEAERLVNNYKGAESISAGNGAIGGQFNRADMGMFRGTKQSFYAYFSNQTKAFLEANTETVKAQSIAPYVRKKGLVNPKYVRKFVFDRMIGLDVPESVADFIEGRIPKRIGAKHYMAMARQANNFYARYGRDVEALRQQAAQKEAGRITV